MASTITWSGSSSGEWFQPLDWSALGSVPTAADDVVIPAGDTVTIDGSAAVAASISLDPAPPTAATLDLISSLTLGGTLTGGVVELAGTLIGGTLENTILSGQNGTLEGVTVAGSMTSDPIGYVAIDPATAASFGPSITVSGTLTLEAGAYDSVTLTQMSGFSYLYGLVGIGGAVTLGPQAVMTNLGVWSGDLVNLGTIGTGPAATLSLLGGSFTNQGTVSLTPVATAKSTIVAGASYHWTEETAPAVTIASASVDNVGVIAVAGGTLALSGASLRNSGTIALTDGASQVFVNAGTNSTVENVTLTTAVTLGASNGSIDNTGTISADLIVFAGPVALGSLGTLKGALQFDNTLSLGGGTLDASAYGTVWIDGEVTNGTLKAGTGTLILDNATLDAVSIASGGSVAIAGTVAMAGVPAGASAVVLGATTTELILPAGSALGDVTITAGGSGISDTLLLPAGVVTLTPTAAITVAGGTLALVGPGMLEADGLLNVAAGTLGITAPLDGTGTIALAAGATLIDSNALGGSLVVATGSNAVVSIATLAGNAEITAAAGVNLDIGTLADNAAVTLDADARVTIEALAGTPTISFGGGPALAVLPGTGALPVTLLNLTGGDVIDFASVSSTPPLNGPAATAGAAEAGGSLDVTGASGDTARVAAQNQAPYLTFSTTTYNGGTAVTAAACYRTGTRIATARGAVPIERLRRGDLIRTRSGRFLPAIWLGRRRIDCRSYRQPAEVWPVRIAAHAFAPSRPVRALYLSPDHAVWLAGRLIPIRYLINGATVAQLPVARVEYWHIELPAHDILFAENLPAESYLDTGNRAAFEGAQRRHRLSDAVMLRVWQRHARAPLLISGPRLAAAHAQLVARARLLGHRLTEAPALRVLADGHAAAPLGSLRFRLPEGARAIQLCSRSFVPAHLAGHGHDPRRLGVAVRGLSLDGEPLALDDPRLAAGWHAPEPGWRWTSGDAVIATAGARELAIDLAITGRYWRAG